MDSATASALANTSKETEGSTLTFPSLPLPFSSSSAQYLREELSRSMMADSVDQEAESSQGSFTPEMPFGRLRRHVNPNAVAEIPDHMLVNQVSRIGKLYSSSARSLGTTIAVTDVREPAVNSSEHFSILSGSNLSADLPGLCLRNHTGRSEIEVSESYSDDEDIQYDLFDLFTSGQRMDVEEEPVIAIFPAALWES
ncbi:hypothetical protein RRG08_052267 [Elysia crispata]|uniref:Uncharacterized protein n=1 Tax=Elysia crispata TaxID=231223 RepID=A0AAE0ZYQ3_9GAST|nr:hypothetical protein RRG08_052267 [Elysia crispata]